MTETAYLIATCSKCKHEWKPYGIAPQMLPYSETLTCPVCRHVEKMDWYDTETDKKRLQQKLGLLGDKELTNRVADLERKLSLLQQELDIERKKRELGEADIQQIKTWATIREKDFKDIELLAEEERQRITDNEDLK